MSAQQPTTAAIVPYRSKTPVVQFAADGVAADVRVEPLDRRWGTSLYAIRLASAEENLVGRLVGELPSGEPVELGDLAVTPGSIGGARLAVTPPRGGYRSVYLEIRSERVLLRVEAPKPPAARRVGPFTAAAIVLGLGVLSAAAGAAALAVPEAPVLRGPERAVAGDFVHVQYAAHGYGSERFTARYDDGSVFASGALETQNGDLTVALPRDAVNRRVWVAVTTQGFLGTASGVTSFAVAAPAVADIPARVLSFAARRDLGPGGETVLASYLAAADRGTVTLQDDRGRVISSAPFTHVGTSRLPVAPAYRERSLTARISVERGGTHAVASVALAPSEPVAIAAVPPTPARDVAPSPAVARKAPAQTPNETAGMLAFEPSAVAGSELAVRVMPHRSPMTVAMQDVNGETLAEREIAPGTTSITLPMPERPATYYLLLRYEGDDGVQTVVRPVRAVAPRAAQESSR